MDREYFRNVYAKVVYGLTDDSAVRAVEAASDINSKTIKIRGKDDKETDFPSSFIWEFVHDTFTHPDITRIVDPAGGMKLDMAEPALATLSAEVPKAKRNTDNLEQSLFGVRCYVALGHKLLAFGHYNEAVISRTQMAEELEAVAKEFEALQVDFQWLWLAEDQDNEGYQELVKRFLYTIIPCREKAKLLLVGGEQRGTMSVLEKGIWQ